MAEFKEVVHHFRRMVKSWEDSGIFDKDSIEKAALSMIAIPNESVALSFERYVMHWAKEHPEKKYPSLAEWWKSTYPHSSSEGPPCWRYFLSAKDHRDMCDKHTYSCASCKNEPMSKDVAEKLGIEPQEE